MQVTGRFASLPIRSMFAPLAAIRPGDGRDGGGRELAAQDRHVQAAAPPLRLAGAGGDLCVQVQVGGDGRHLAVDRRQVRLTAAGQQYAEDEATADDDLLDV